MSARRPTKSTRSAAIVVTPVGRVPVRGEVVPGPGEFEIEVLDADPRRVKRRADPSRARTANGAAARARSVHAGAEAPARAPPPIAAATNRRPDRSRAASTRSVARRGAVLGLAPRRHRIRGGRGLRAGARAVQRLAGAVSDLSGRWSG